ncbi:MAG: CYTH domain-containing protein [Prolixibacteraceae bacterium]
MTLEIERKFLVLNDDYKAQSNHSTRIKQGYLSSVHGRTVRVRIKGENGYLTIKGKSNASGTTRFEWEREIPAEEAIELLTLCEPVLIDKTRYEVNLGSHTFEIDEFYGENQGLVVAEIELSHEDEAFDKPSWLGLEVTGDVRYYNSALMKYPYSSW